MDYDFGLGLRGGAVMRKFALLVLLCVPKVWALTPVASVSGNWNNTATWGGAAIPVSGDTVTINNGITVTVPAGYAAVVGSSPVDDTGTPAIQCQATSGTGILIVFGSLKTQGPVRQCNANWTISTANWAGVGDGSWTCDATGAANPATALYTWQVEMVASQANAVLLINGTSTHHVVLGSASNIACGGIGNTGASLADGGRVEATFFDISFMGAASATGQVFNLRLTSATARFILANGTIDHCGWILSGTAIGPTSFFSITNVIETNPVNTTTNNPWLEIQVAASRTTGTRLISNVVYKGLLFIAGGAGANDGFTIDEVVSESLASQTSQLNFTNGGSSNSWTNVLIYGALGSGASVVPSGTLSSTYIMEACNPGSPCANTQPVTFRTSSVNTTITGWVFDGMQSTDDGDQLKNSADATVSGTTLTITHNVFLPNSAGIGLGSFFNNFSGAAQTNMKTSFTNNTGVTSQTGGTVEGVGCEVNTSLPAGAIPQIANNIVWRPTSGTGSIANSITTGGTPCVITAGAVTVANFNNAFQITGSIYGNPSGQFAVTPGANDLAVNPGYVDTSRNFMSYDTASAATGGVGNAVATAWVTATAYNVGDIRSASTTGFFGGATFNYYCTAAHTSGATTKPGSGSAWNQSWTPATLHDIEVGVLGSTTPNIATLLSWVHAGYQFTNAALHNTGLGGIDIGSEPYLPPASNSAFFWFQ